MPMWAHGYSADLGLMSLTLETDVKNTEAEGRPEPESSAGFSSKHSGKMGCHFHSWAFSIDHCCKTYQLGCASSQETTAGYASSVFPSLLSHNMTQVGQRPTVSLSPHHPVACSQIRDCETDHEDPDQHTMSVRL